MFQNSIPSSFSRLCTQIKAFFFYCLFYMLLNLANIPTKFSFNSWGYQDNKQTNKPSASDLPSIYIFSLDKHFLFHYNQRKQPWLNTYRKATNYQNKGLRAVKSVSVLIIICSILFYKTVGVLWVALLPPCLFTWHLSKDVPSASQEIKKKQQGKWCNSYRLIIKNNCTWLHLMIGWTGSAVLLVKQTFCLPTAAPPTTLWLFLRTPKRAAPCSSSTPSASNGWRRCPRSGFTARSRFATETGSSVNRWVQHLFYISTPLNPLFPISLSPVSALSATLLLLTHHISEGNICTNPCLFDIMFQTNKNTINL